MILSQDRLMFVRENASMQFPGLIYNLLSVDSRRCRKNPICKPWKAPKKSLWVCEFAKQLASRLLGVKFRRHNLPCCFSALRGISRWRLLGLRETNTGTHCILRITSHPCEVFSVFTTFYIQQAELAALKTANLYSCRNSDLHSI